jgi:hypothetical protein
MLEIVCAHRVRMQLEAGEVRHPRERRRVSRHHFLGAASRWKLQLHRLDPRGPRLRGTLLVEKFALDAIRIAHQHVRTPARAAQRAFGNGEVIAHEVELRVPRLWEKDLLRIGDRHLAASDREDLSFTALGHAGARHSE